MMVANFGGMMGFGGPSALGLLTWLVWLMVGILLCIFLWQKISHK